MKIYFAGSIRGGREDVQLYSFIIKHLGKYGEVLTEHVADVNLLVKGEGVLTDMEIHDRDIDWLMQSDILIAEVTVASLGVGYEIRAAIEMKKKILCLYRPHIGKDLSAMISGCPEITICKYNQLDKAFEIIDDFFQKN